MGRKKSDGLKSEIKFPYLPIIDEGRIIVPYCYHRQNHCSTSRDICDGSCTSYQELEINQDNQYYPREQFNLKQLIKLIKRKPEQPRLLLAPTSNDEHGILYLPFCTNPMHPGVPNERICTSRGCGRLHRLELAFEEPPVIKLNL